MKFIIETVVIDGAYYGKCEKHTINADSPQGAVNKIRRTLPKYEQVSKVYIETTDWK